MAGRVGNAAEMLVTQDLIARVERRPDGGRHGGPGRNRQRQHDARRVEMKASLRPTEAPVRPVSPCASAFRRSARRAPTFAKAPEGRDSMKLLYSRGRRRGARRDFAHHTGARRGVPYALRRRRHGRKPDRHAPAPRADDFFVPTEIVISLHPDRYLHGEGGEAPRGVSLRLNRAEHQPLCRRSRSGRPFEKGDGRARRGHGRGNGGRVGPARAARRTRLRTWGWWSGDRGNEFSPATALYALPRPNGSLRGRPRRVENGLEAVGRVLKRRRRPRRLGVLLYVYALHGR